MDKCPYCQTECKMCKGLFSRTYQTFCPRCGIWFSETGRTIEDAVREHNKAFLHTRFYLMYNMPP